MIVRFTLRAVGDIETIADYIKAHNPITALQIEQAITTNIEHLLQHPLLGTDRPVLTVRALAIARYPYTVYYRIDSGTIVIIHIRDDRRAPLAAGDL